MRKVEVQFVTVFELHCELTYFSSIYAICSCGGFCDCVSIRFVICPIDNEVTSRRLIYSLLNIDFGVVTDFEVKCFSYDRIEWFDLERRKVKLRKEKYPSLFTL